MTEMTLPYYNSSLLYKESNYLPQIVNQSCLTSNIRKRSLENRANMDSRLTSPGLEQMQYLLNHSPDISTV